MALQHLRSSTADKRPDPTAMADGQLAINTNSASTGLFYKNSAGALVKVGPAHVGTTAPNATPASGGTAGNSTGEAWLDTSGTNPVLKIWDGSAWQTVQPIATGTVVSTADTGTVTSTMIADGTIVDADVNASAAIAGTKISPDFGSQNVTTTGTSTAASFIPTSSTVPTNGVYLPAANSVAISTNGTGRLFVDASGNVTINGQGDLRFADADSSNWVAFQAPATVASNVTWMLPDADGTSGQVLSTDGSGTLSWATAAAGTTDKIEEGNTSAEVIDTGSDGRFVVTTEGVEALRVDSSQRVGIGTTSPNERLTVSGNVSATNFYGYGSQLGDGGLAFYNAGASDKFIKASDDSGSINVIGIKKTGAATANVWFPSGSVGIGTSSPDAKLQVEGAVDTSSSTLRITATGACSAGFSCNSNGTVIGTDTGGILFKTGVSANTPTTTGSERARIDSSGRLLVGTSSARATFGSSAAPQFQSEGTTTATGSIAVIKNNAIDGGYIFLANTGGSTVGSTTATAGGSELGAVSFNGFDGSNFKEGATIRAVNDQAGAWASGDCPSRLVFSTTADGAFSPTERMRIGNSGDSALYTQNTGGTLLNMQTAASAGTSASLITGTYGATAVLTGTVSIRIWSNGNIQNTNNSYGALSDIKLKENIADAGSQWADLKALRVCNYNLKEGQTHRQIGLIAQEVELISPGLVYESPDRDAEGNDLGTVTKSVNYSVLYMKAVKALQEAMERIETLEQRLADAGIA